MLPISQEELREIPVHLSKRQLNDPFSYVRKFFDEEIDIIHAKADLQLMFRSALSKKCLLSRKQIVSIFRFREIMFPRIEAASIIDSRANAGISYHFETGSVKGSVISTEESELFCESNFCGKKHYIFSTWDYLPHYLNKLEYADPGMAIRNIFIYKTSYGWKTFLEELFSAATSQSALHSYSDEKDIVKSYEYLAKLLEALYLVNIRTQKAPSDSPLSPH